MRNRKKGFNLIELMVVIAIIAILAAVALPMYSNFKRRSKAATAAKSVSQSLQVLQSWWESRNSFDGITLSGGVFVHGTQKVGTSVGSVPDCNFSLVPPTDSKIIVLWDFNQGCPDCAGRVCLYCTENFCSTEVRLVQEKYNLNRQSDSALSACDI